MSMQHVIKMFACWVVAWTVGAAMLGLVLLALGDTGHVGPVATILILTTAGGIFGVIGGGIFAALFTWLTSDVVVGSTRAFMAAVLGALSGLPGIYVADRVIGISSAIMVGSVAGAVTGLVCGALPVSKHGRSEGPA